MANAILTFHFDFLTPSLMPIVFLSYKLKENISPMKEGIVQSMKEEMKNSRNKSSRVVRKENLSSCIYACLNIVEKPSKMSFKTIALKLSTFNKETISS